MRPACVHLQPLERVSVLPDSIRVVQLILVQFVLVRIQVRQQYRNISGWFSTTYFILRGSTSYFSPYSYAYFEWNSSFWSQILQWNVTFKLYSWIDKPIKTMANFISALVLNLILMFLSISLTNTLYTNKLIDKSNRNSLILLSVCIPIGGLITLALKYKRLIAHLANLKDLKTK